MIENIKKRSKKVLSVLFKPLTIRLEKINVRNDMNEGKINLLSNKLFDIEKVLRQEIAGVYNSTIPREQHKNKPLFIIGSGPSIKDMDISKLKDCYTMSFNRSFIAFKDWGFEPTYFAGLDLLVNNDNKSEYRKLIKDSSIERFFFTKDEAAETYFNSPKCSLVEIFGGDPENPTLNFYEPLVVGNSGLFGLQIALGLLGFSEVYLLGCDANYTDSVPGIEIINGEYRSKSDNDVNHFRKDYYGKGTTYNRPDNLRWHYPAWKAFNDKYIKDNNLGYKVYNCSKISKLKFFPYVNYEEITKSISKYERSDR